MKKPVKNFTIGIIKTSSAFNSGIDGLKAGMAEFDIFKGNTISYIYEGPTRGKKKLKYAVERLLKAKVDLIISITTPATQVVLDMTENMDVPVLFMVVLDPIGTGIVQNLKQPGGNITGVSNSGGNDRRLEWLKILDPRIKCIYIPYCSDDIAPVIGLREVKEAALKLGIKLITYEVHNVKDITAAIENFPKEAKAFFLLNDSFIVSYLDKFINAAINHKVPLSVPNIGQVKAGALTSFGFSPFEVGKQVARLAEQILSKGSRPGDLPVESAEFYLAINLKMAQAIGLDIPDAVIQQSHVIIRE